METRKDTAARCLHVIYEVVAANPGHGGWIEFVGSASSIDTLFVGGGVHALYVRTARATRCLVSRIDAELVAKAPSPRDAAHWNASRKHLFDFAVS